MDFARCSTRPPSQRKTRLSGESRGELRVDQGEVAVHTAGQDPAPELLGVREERFCDLLRALAALQAFGLGLHGVGKAREAALRAVGQDLAAGEDQGALHVLHPALTSRVEKAHGVDLIAEEFAADGLFHEGGEDVQDAAPDGELPHAFHLEDPGVARRRQALRKGGKIQGLFRL